MTDLPLVFVGGVLGSAHCIGMCGPLAIGLSMNLAPGASLFGRQLLFSLGRLCTYATGGALAGYGGLWLSAQSAGFAATQAWLAIAAGVALLAIGLTAAGVLPRRWTTWFNHLPCGGAWLKTFLASGGWSGPLLAGVFTGFIPCGLVYAFLLKAGSAGGIWQGWLTMAAFGLGTFPLMIAWGYGGTWLTHSRRAQVFRLAAWCIVLTGGISIARGASQVLATEPASPDSCPWCVADDGAPIDATTPAPPGSTRPPR